MGNCGSKREPAGAAASDMITIGTTDKTDAYAQLDGEGYVMMVMIIYTCRELFFKLLLLVGIIVDELNMFRREIVVSEKARYYPCSVTISLM